MTLTDGRARADGMTSLTLRLKIGVLVSAVAATVSNYWPESSGQISVASFACAALFIVPSFKLSPSAARQLAAVVLLSVALLSTIAALTAESSGLYVAWYVVLTVLLCISSGVPALRVRLRRRPGRLARLAIDGACFTMLGLALLSSFLFFSTGLGIANPNAMAALCGGLWLVAVLDRGTAKTAPRPSARATSLVYASAICCAAQLSRSIVFWAVAAYVIQLQLAGIRRPLGIAILRVSALLLLVAPVLVVAVADRIDVDVISDAILGLPDVFRLKEGGLESDVLRFVRYPALLASQMDKGQDALIGLGFGARPYLDELQPGEDLHNAYLVIISDGGIALLALVLLLVANPTSETREMNALRLVIFASATAFSGLLVGLAPFTLTIAGLLVAARNLPADGPLSRAAIHPRPVPRRRRVQLRTST